MIETDCIVSGALPAVEFPVTRRATGLRTMKLNGKFTVTLDAELAPNGTFRLTLTLAAPGLVSRPVVK
jgi:hypothetical protein